MTTTFATPLIRTASNAATAVRQNSKSITQIISDLFKNKGVQVGVGFGAAGAGLGVLSSSAKEATQPFGELSPILIIIVAVVILALVMRGR